MLKVVTYISVSCLTMSIIFSGCFRKVTKTQINDEVIIQDSVIKIVEVEEEQEEEEYFQENFMRYENYTYDDNIKTILLHREGAEMTPAIIKLNSTEKLKLTFDDLDPRAKEYFYTVIHCDGDWKPSALEPYEYLESFTEAEIYDYVDSYNTIQDYFNYTVTFPNQDINITKSGNYILKVYLKGQEEKPAFTRRFMVFDPKIDIDIFARRATDIELRNYFQEVDFTIHTKYFRIENPYQNLKVVIRQNNRWDNAIYGLQPKFVNDHQIVYDFETGNIFPGNNEFRNFDIKSVKYQTMRIRKIDFKLNQYHAYVQDDIRRPFQRYISETDINGKKLIKNEDADDSNIESEYVNVYFNLPYKTILGDGSIYIFGEITDWQFKEEAKLKYDFTTNSYRASLYLKQGYYNYVYAYLENEDSEADIAFIEGNHWETENDYMVLVYYRMPGDLHDSLIGVQYANTVTK